MVNRLLYVIYDTVSDNEQNLKLLVAIAPRVSLSDVVHCVENTAEVGGPVQIHNVHAVLVVLHHSLKSVNLRVEDVAVHRETVMCALVVWGDSSTESEQIDLLIRVVVLKDTADLVDHLKVLVARWVEVVQRFRGAGVPVTQREIDSDGEVNITAAKNVLEERVLLLKLAFAQAEKILVECKFIIGLAFKHPGAAQDRSLVLVSSAFRRKEDLNLEFLFDVIITKIGQAQCALSPRDNISSGSLNLRFIQRCPLIRTTALVYDEKVGARRTLQLSVGKERQQFAVCVFLHVLSNDANVCLVAALSLNEALVQGLIAARHHLVKGELKRAQVIMFVSVVDLRIVINIVYIDLELVV